MSGSAVVIVSSGSPAPPPRRRSFLALSFGLTSILIAVLMAGVVLTGAEAEAATYTLTSSGGADVIWTDSTKWFGGPAGTYPGQNAGDTAQITQSGTYKVMVSSTIPNNVTLTMNCSGCFLEIQSGGTLGLQGSSSVTGSNIRLLTSGILNNSNDLTFASTLFLDGGTVGNVGTININPTGIFEWNGGTLTSAGTTNVFGTLNLPGAISSMTLGPGQQLNVSGTINYTSPSNPFSINTGAALLNSNLMNLANDLPINGAGSIQNTGTIDKTTGTQSVINPSVANSGTVRVSEGVLALNGGGTHSGTFDAASAGYVIEFRGGTHILNVGSAFTGPGYVKLAGGTLNFNGPLTTAGGFAQVGGTLTGSSSFTIGGDFTWWGGTQNGTGSTILNGNSSLTGQIGAMTLSRTMQNGGTLTYAPSGGSLTLTNGILNNTVTIDVAGDFNVLSGGGTNAINIASGSLKKSAGASGARFDVPVHVTGSTASVVSQAGTIIFNAGGSMTQGSMGTQSAAEMIDFFGGTFTVSGGFFSTAGRFRVLGTGVLQANTNLSATNLDVLAGTLDLGGTSTFQAQNLDWSGGTVQGTGTLRTFNGRIRNLASTILGGSATLTNAGTFAYEADLTNFLTMGGTADLNTESGSTFSIINDSLLGGSATNAVTNMGTFHKTGGAAGQTRISPPVTSTGGSIGSTMGKLQFLGGGTFSSTTIQTSTSGTVSFSGGGTYNINTGTTIGGTGFVEVVSGIVNANVPLTFPNLNISGGTLTGSSPITVSGAGSWTGGTLAGSSTATFNSLNIGSTSLKVLDSRSLTSNATTVASTGTLELRNAAQITNNGTFNLIGSGPVTLGTGGGSITNVPSSVFSKSNGAASVINAPIANNGEIRCSAGVLTLLGNLSGTGIITTSTTGSRVELGGTQTISGSITGSGEIQFLAGSATTMTGAYSMAQTRVTGGTATFSGPTTLGALVLNSGTIAGAATQSITAQSFWQGGTMAGPGSTTVSPGGTLEINASLGNATLDGRTLINNATITYPASLNTLTLSNGGIIQNDGVFSLTGDAAIFTAGSGSITNSVTFQKTAGTGTSAIHPGFTNTGSVVAQSGTINFVNGYTQTAGLTLVGPGNVASNLFQINGGTLSGNGTMTGNVSSSGTVSPGLSPGILTINGNYTQTAAGILNIDIGGTTPGTQYDRLAVSGTAEMNGTINVALVGAFVPSGGSTFDVITYSAHIGDFTTKNFPTFGSGGFFSDTYTPTAYQLQAQSNQSDLALTQTNSGPALHNQNVTFTVTLTNNGPDAATNVNVDDTFTNATFVSATSTIGTCTGTGPVSCSIATLNPGESAVITLTLKASNVGTITNDVQYFSQTTFDPNANNNQPPTSSITVSPAADLSITITDAPDPVTANANTVYTVKVANAGPDPATGANVAFQMENGSIVSMSGAPFFCSGAGPSGSCNITSPLAPGNYTITVTARAPATAGSMSLTGTASSSTADPVTTNNTAVQQTTVTAQADVQIQKTGPTAAQTAGSNVTFTTSVKNLGPSSATGVVVTDPTPAGATFVSNSGACTTPFPCSLGTLTVNQIATITTTYALAPNASGTMSNTASVTTSSTDPVATNNSSTATVAIQQRADVQVIKTAPEGGAAPGSNVTFTVTVKNNGPSNATNVVVNDPTPAGLTFVSNTGGCTTPYPCSLGTLAPNQIVTISSTYSVSPNASGTITNTASVSTSTTDPTTTNNSSSASFTIQPRADVSITKTGPATASAGEVVSYTISVRNAGPSDAFDVQVQDPTPAGTTFVRNTGACNHAFPCSLGTLTSAQVATIFAEYRFNTSDPVTNIATVSAATFDPNLQNNTASTTTSGGVSCPTDVPNPISPRDVNDAPTAGTLSWSAAGGSYVVFLGPAGTGCNTPFGSTPQTSMPYSGLIAGAEYEWRVEATSPGCQPRASSCVRFRTRTTCTTAPPALVAPAANVVLASPIFFQWDPVPGATSYQLVVARGTAAPNVVGTTTGTSFSGSFDNGPLTWWVMALGVPGCPSLESQHRTFTICNNVVVPRVVGEATSGQTYRVEWDAIPGATRYQIEEARNPDFIGATTRSVTNPSASYTHVTDTPVAFYYRVKTFSPCAPAGGPYSLTVRVVIIPLPPKEQANPSTNVPAGSTQVVVQEVFIPGEPGKTLFFNASVDRFWLTVSPLGGLLPPEGVTLQVLADPAQLPNGTFTASILVVITPAPGSGVGAVTSNQTTTKTVPVSVNLVTPVSPVAQKPAPAADALIFPAVGHLTGANSKWQSDVRLTNIGATPLKYNLTFVPSAGAASNAIKSTIIDVDAGATTALDDIVKNWYGVGSLGDGANGVLEVRSATPSAPSVSLTTVASSRTYNISANGTLGQFVPALPFSSFIGRSAGTAGLAVLSLQQVAQSAAFRTNVGIVEAAGQPASVLLSIFGDAGTKLLDIPVSIKANEQLQLNSLLAEHGLTVNDGRIEVRVTGGDGKVTAYASTVDNKTNDPLLVAPVLIGSRPSTKWVLPGVADLRNPVANWQTDMRVFNSGTGSASATVRFVPQGSGLVSSQTVTIAPGEVKKFDNVLASLFGVTNMGGAVHVSTTSQTGLVISGRTYNNTGNGTYGQFVPAVTEAEAVGRSSRPLHILQVEDSTRYRTNLGLVEVSGRPVTVLVQVFLPDSKVTPRVEISLAPNEFRQFAIIRELGLGNVYNARISVQVVGGDGRVTAYGSVIDEVTQDPTYVPAQ